MPEPPDGSAPPASPQPTDAEHELLKRYWRTNIAIMSVLLAIWAVAGLGCGVLFADALNAYSLGGYPLGFWFAQQGSIIIFVLIILAYCILLNRLDKHHHNELTALRGNGNGNGANANGQAQEASQ